MLSLSVGDKYNLLTEKHNISLRVMRNAIAEDLFRKIETPQTYNTQQIFGLYSSF